MRVLSLFSGIGGFDLGLERAGMTVIAQAENDPYCLRQLARHWPGVTRYEDVRSVGVGRSADHKRGEPHDGEAGTAAAQWDGARVDLVCGGFPCQDLSVAGKRAGLDGARSGLWFEFQRIVSEVRPKYVLVENVPGLLSSNGGRDFAVILDGLGELGYAVSWTVLDSQHFGVAQRRRRVFIVAGPDPESCEQILSISESCGGHPAAGRAAGEDVAGEAGDGLAKSLRARANDSHREDSSTYIPDVSPSLTQRDYKSQREDIAEPAFVAFNIQHNDGGSHKRKDRPHGGMYVNETDTALNASEDGTGRGTPLVVDESLQPAHPSVAVRRLTPTEACRLQGFPDDWLDVDGADGPQYRALGNAVSVPVIEYLGKRIMSQAVLLCYETTGLL